MTVQKRLIFGYTLIIMVVLASGIINLVGTEKIIEFIRQEEFYYEHISTISTEIISYVKRAEGHALLYLILDREEDRQKFYERMTFLKQKIHELNSVANDSYTKQKVREFLAGNDHILAQGTQLFALVDNYKSTEEKIVWPQKEELISAFHQSSSDLRAKTVDFSLHHLRQFKEVSTQSYNASNQMQFFLLFDMFCSLSLILLIGYWGTKALTKPIGEFTQALIKFRQGDLNQEIKYDRPDEFGLFMQTLNHMRDNLVTTKAKMIQSAKLSSLGEIATGVGHELNQPLATINLSAELAEESLDANDYDNVRHLLRMIQSQVNRASKIMDHMKIFGRDSISMELHYFQINEVIENVFILIAEQLKLRNIVVEKHLKANLPNLHGNPIQIEQIILNLIVNARNAMESSEEKKLTINSFSCDSSEIIEISDTGCGISADLREKIFEPFYTTKGTGLGTGLGLSICAGIMAEHQGQITVESTVGKGTSFRLRFPIPCS